jgi:hypothetical protein
VQPSSAITRATIPTGKRLAARTFIRLSTAPPRCGTRVFRLHVSQRTQSLLARRNPVNHATWTFLDVRAQWQLPQLPL